MTPQALSVFVPLDKCTEANVCLQIITGTLSQGLQSGAAVTGGPGAAVNGGPGTLDSLPLV